MPVLTPYTYGSDKLVEAFNAISITAGFIAAATYSPLVIKAFRPADAAIHSGALAARTVAAHAYKVERHLMVASLTYKVG
jgi:hypothetical protein